MTRLFAHFIGHDLDSVDQSVEQQRSEIGRCTYDGLFSRDSAIFETGHDRCCLSGRHQCVDGGRNLSHRIPVMRCEEQHFVAVVGYEFQKFVFIRRCVSLDHFGIRSVKSGHIGQCVTADISDSAGQPLFRIHRIIVFGIMPLYARRICSRRYIIGQLFRYGYLALRLLAE